MTFAEFDEFTETFLKEVRKMKDTKGKEYANTTDRFDNFNRLALKNDVERLVVANIYMTKHLDAIDSYIKTGREHSSELIRGRFIDAVTYLILMAGMQAETKPVTKLDNTGPYFQIGDTVKYFNYIYKVKELYNSTALLCSDDGVKQSVLLSEICHYPPKT